jgi:hypothetical protein
MTKHSTAVGFPDGGDEDRVVNLSGTPGNSQLPRTTTPRPREDPSPMAWHRAQVMIDAQSGQELDSRTAQLLVHAAHRADQEHFDRQKDTSPGAYLAHVFGARDRAD